VIDHSSKKVAIIGQGYVGLPLAINLSTAGWLVYGIDNDEDKVSNLKNGFSAISDVSNEQLVNSLNSNLYSPTCDYSKVGEASVVVICVPTPLGGSSKPDLSLLNNAIVSISMYVKDQSLIILESTSYPGTLRDFIIPLFNEHKKQDVRRVYFAVSPERVNPADKFWNQRNTPRVIGAIDDESLNLAQVFYSDICESITTVSSPEIAEISKLFENTFRLVNISLVNEFAKAASNLNLDVYEVLDAAATKPYGFLRFDPGVGAGGHCIPVDPAYLTWWADNNKQNISLVDKSLEINSLIPNFVADRAISLIKNFSQHTRILVIGISYKSGVIDCRESPSIAIIEKLRSKGITVDWHDPFVGSWLDETSSEINGNYELLILTVNQSGLVYSLLLKCGVTILDCTRTLTTSTGVHSLY
jgi:UDP-N-acetyl-D-glucosamine dehydrogenase